MPPILEIDKMIIQRYLLVIFLIPLLYGQKIEPGPAFIVKISEDAARQIEQENGVVRDTILLNRLLPVVRKVMRASDVRIIFDCRIINSEIVNAFALPAGPIYVTIGMLQLLDSLKTEESKSMLAGVLGHEIAHVYLRHSVAWLRLSNFIKEGAIALPADIAEILVKGYTRQQEFEADEYGVLYAMRAGYDFESIIKFYKMVRDLYGDIPPGDERYNDHPRAAERIARLYEVRAQMERDYDQFNFGVEALNQGRYNDAINHFRYFTTTFSNSASGWTNLGTAYLFEALSKMEDLPVLFMITFYGAPKERLRGKPDELLYAEEAFKRAIEIDTSYNIVYYGNMGIIAAVCGEYDKAISFTQKALEGEEAQYFLYNNLGNIYYFKKDYSAAEELYKRAIEVNKNWKMPVFNLAVLYETTDRRDLAIQTWRSLLDVSGYRKEVIKHLARLDKKFKSDLKGVKPEVSLGNIRLDMSEDSVTSILGQPDNKTALENLFALEYKEKGFVIFLRDKEVTGILGTAQCCEKTTKGIGVNSTTNEIISAYGFPDDIVTQRDGEQWIYSVIGLLINIYENGVSSFQIVKVQKQS